MALLWWYLLLLLLQLLLLLLLLPEFGAVREEVDVEHVGGLHVHHEVPRARERGLARHAVQPGGCPAKNSARCLVQKRNFSHFGYPFFESHLDFPCLPPSSPHSPVNNKEGKSYYNCKLYLLFPLLIFIAKFFLKAVLSFLFEIACLGAPRANSSSPPEECPLKFVATATKGNIGWQ